MRTLAALFLVLAAEPPRVDPSPGDFRVMAVGGVVGTDRGPSVVLVDDRARTVLPILVDAREVDALRSAPQAPPDGLDVRSVRIDRLDRDGVIRATVALADRTVDVKPSDAIRLALAHSLPVLVAEPVLDGAGFSVDAEANTPYLGPALGEQQRQLVRRGGL